MPSTAAGKALSSQNATSHGLTASQAIVQPEEQAEYDQLILEYHGEIKPQGSVENTLFGALIHAAWNMRRACRLEAQLFTGGVDPLLDEASGKLAERFQRYHDRHFRNYTRTLKELRAAQTQRLQKALAEPELAAAAPPLADPAELTKRTQLVSVDQALHQLTHAMDNETHLLAARHRLQISLQQAGHPTAAGA